MKFIHDDFLLDTQAARELYHDHAAHMPIIDFHCHLDPAEIASDRRWENITQIWLGGDHYKWRAMRAAGVAEEYCTGSVDDWEKFQQFAATMPKLLRNPLYHWSHLELARYFGVDDMLLNPETAAAIYAKCNKAIKSPAFSCRQLIQKSRVEIICTTDDPTDSLEHHKRIAADPVFTTQVLPTWRPDQSLIPGTPAAFAAWVAKLESASGATIKNLDDFMNALQSRHDFFSQCGCRISDRGIEAVPDCDFTRAAASAVFDLALKGGVPDPAQLDVYRAFMLHELAAMDARKDWAMQIHFGALRNNSSRMMASLGKDAGFDSIGDWAAARGLARHLDRLDSEKLLPKTILYNLNPAANEMVATMIGNFQDGSVPGKMQMGSGWWFLDQLDGMTRQIESISQLGLLSEFIGMLTDSRSFLSYTRHEYFRRLLCSILGSDIERGRIPRDMALVGSMVRDICYHNSKLYFGF